MLVSMLVPAVAEAGLTTSTSPTPPDLFVAYSPLTSQGSTLGADTVESFNTSTLTSFAAHGFATATVSGTTTMGSPTVTAITSSVPLFNGMSISGASFPPGTTILSTTPTSLTLSNNALSSGAAVLNVKVTGNFASQGSAQVGAQPVSEVVSPDGGTVYVLNSASDSVTPVSTLGSPASQSPYALPSGYTPTAIALTPDGADAYITAQSTVSNAYAPVLWEISLTGSSPGTLARTIVLPSSTSPAGLALTPSGQTALITNFSGGTVLPVRLSSGSVGTPIGVGPGPLGIAVSPNGNDAYVANSEGGSVTQIQLSNDSASPATTLDAGYQPQQVAISPDGSTLFVSEDNAASPGSAGFVAQVSIPSMTVGVPMTVGYDPYGLAVSPDGSTVYVADETSLNTNEQGAANSAGGVSMINVAAGTVQSFLTNIDPISVVVTPDEAPVASFSVQTSPTGSATAFDASASYSLTGGPLTFSWNFGDGSFSPAPPVPAPANYLETTSHVYVLPGTYKVTLTVTDASGTSTSVVYTGQYVSNNGGPSAAVTTSINIPSSGTMQPPVAYVADAQSNQVTPLWADPAHASAPNVAGPPIAVGTHPSAIAITPNGQTAFVVNYGSNNVTPISTSTNIAAPGASWIPVGSEPDAIAITPNGQTAYVANSGSGSITKFDVGSGSVQATINVGGNPTGIAISPDGTTAYVTNNNSGYENLIPIRLSDDAVLPGIPVGTMVGGVTNATDPVAVAITPDGKMAYVVDRGSIVVAGAITPIDLTTGVAAAPFRQYGGSGASIGSNPDAIAINPNGTAMYVTNFTDGTITEIGLLADQPDGVAVSGAGHSPLAVAVTPNGAGAYIADGVPTSSGLVTPPGTVSVLEGLPSDGSVPPAAAVPASIGVGVGPDAIAITPDQAPVATLTVAPGVAGSPSYFDASQSVFPSAGPFVSPSTNDSYAWNFGDGTTTQSTGPNVTHTYTHGGNFTASVTITDADGTSTTQFFTGQTVSLNGSAAASASQAVNVPFVAPVVSSVSPATGSSGSATSVIVTGSNFYGVSAVDLGTTALSAGTDYHVVSSTEIDLTVPATLGVGSVDVLVTNPAGTSLVSPGDVFTNLPTTAPAPGAPSITSMSVHLGPVEGGTGVTITGANFTGATSVDFGGVASTQFAVSSDGSTITAISPAAPTGTVDVTVTTPVATSAVSAADAFSYIADPVTPAVASITSVSPDHGPTSGLTTVTVTGVNLSDVVGVSFGAAPAESFHSVSSSSLTAVTAPVASAQTVDVRVTTTTGTTLVVPADRFTFESGIPSAGPVVSSVTPDSGPLSGNNSVVIDGSNFFSVSVAFGSQNVSGAKFSVNSAGTQIIASAPGVASPQSVDVIVSNSLGNSVISPSDGYTYQDDALFAPTLTSVSPASGPEAGGTSVTLTGTGFTTASDVHFGSIDVPSTSPGFVISNGGDTITLNSPAAASAGTVSVTVTNPYGVSAIVAADAYTYLPTSPIDSPAVTDVTPNTGGTSGGTGVVITGTGFTGATAVDFGANAAASFTVESDTEIIAVTSGPTSAGSVDVLVTTGAGTSSVATTDVFTFLLNSLPSPMVTSISPSSGPTTGGTLVTVTGSNLTGALAVDFGSASGTDVVVNSTGSSLTVMSPASTYSATVAVTVATPGGLSAASPATQFTYVAVPSTYVPLAPVRALDTRIAGSGGPFGAHTTRSLVLAGKFGVPSGASGVLVNLTATLTTASSHLTLYPAGEALPTASSLLVGKNQTIAHLVEVPLGSGGAISIYNDMGSAHVVIDVEGYFMPGTGTAGRFVPVVPVTVLNTSQAGGGGALAPGASRSLNLSVIKGVPANGASAIVFKLTATSSTQLSWIAVRPSGTTRVPSSVLNTTPGAVSSNLVIAKVGTLKSVVIYNYQGKVNLTAVAVGYITSASSSATGSLNTPQVLSTLLDTSSSSGGGPIAAGHSRTLVVAGVGGVPTSAKYVVLNVSVSSTTKASSLALYATGASPPAAGNISWTAGQVTSQLVVVPVGSGGSITLSNQFGSANVVVTVEGSYTA